MSAIFPPPSAYKALPIPVTLSDALAEIARMRPVYLAARDLARDDVHVMTHYRPSVVAVTTALTTAESLLP